MELQGQVAEVHNTDFMPGNENSKVASETVSNKQAIHSEQLYLVMQNYKIISCESKQKRSLLKIFFSDNNTIHHGNKLFYTFKHAQSLFDFLLCGPRDHRFVLCKYYTALTKRNYIL